MDCPFYFVQICLFILKAHPQKEGERQRNRELLATGSLLKRLQHPGLKPETRTILQFSHVGTRGQSLVLSSAVPGAGAWSWTGFREPAIGIRTHKGCWHCKCLLSPLCHHSTPYKNFLHVLDNLFNNLLELFLNHLNYGFCHTRVAYVSKLEMCLAPGHEKRINMAHVLNLSY